jgi:hypothetical protein
MAGLSQTSEGPWERSGVERTGTSSAYACQVMTYTRQDLSCTLVSHNLEDEATCVPRSNALEEGNVMRRIQASEYRTCFEASMPCQAVQPAWDFEDFSPRERETDELPIDHAAIVETLVPLLAMAMTLATLLLKAAP